MKGGFTCSSVLRVKVRSVTGKPSRSAASRNPSRVMGVPAPGAAAWMSGAPIGRPTSRVVRISSRRSTSTRRPDPAAACGCGASRSPATGSAAGVRGACGRSARGAAVAGFDVLGRRHSSADRSETMALCRAGEGPDSGRDFGWSPRMRDQPSLIGVTTAGFAFGSGRDQPPSSSCPPPSLSKRSAIRFPCRLSCHLHRSCLPA